MSNPFDNLDLDHLPADVRAVLLAERAARMVAEKRADLLEKSNDQLEGYISSNSHFGLNL